MAGGVNLAQSAYELISSQHKQRMFRSGVIPVICLISMCSSSPGFGKLKQTDGFSPRDCERCKAGNFARNVFLKAQGEDGGQSTGQYYLYVKPLF